jgi:hypothetical protein
VATEAPNKMYMEYNNIPEKRDIPSLISTGKEVLSEPSAKTYPKKRTTAILINPINIPFIELGFAIRPTTLAIMVIKMPIPKYTYEPYKIGSTFPVIDIMNRITPTTMKAIIDIDAILSFINYTLIC